MFDSPVDGAAAHFDLLARSYTNMTLSAAIRKWSGGNDSDGYLSLVTKATGLSPSTRVTRELLASPKGIALVKAMARHEAGREFPMSDDEWGQAQRLAFGLGSYVLPGDDVA